MRKFAREAKVVYKRTKVSFPEKQICSSLNLFDLFKELNLTDSQQESFYVLSLNSKNQLNGFFEAHRGGRKLVMVDPKIVFEFLLASAASNFILIHNHPSGDSRPSREDISMTKKLKQLGEIFDLPLLDHLIITEENYFSLADNGLI